MTAAKTFQTEIGSYPKDFPLKASAGMSLLQFHNISYLIFH